MPTRIAVVLGCRAAPDGRPGPAAARRCARAVELYDRGRVDAILVSGGRVWHGRSEADVMQDYLLGAGVAAAAVFAERCSLNTFENAWFSALLLRGLGARDVVVVTCDFHLPRALRTFRHVGVTASGEAAVTPQLTALRRTSLAVRETFSALLQRPLGALWEL